MSKHQTVLHCSHATAAIFFITIGSLFLLSGCYGLYKSIGLTDDQAAAQAAQDQTTITRILDQSRITTAQIVTSAIAGLGAIASGVLAKWLGTERKITAALITGIEAGDVGDVKGSVLKKATAAGVESKLHRRVVSLT